VIFTRYDATLPADVNSFKKLLLARGINMRLKALLITTCLLLSPLSTTHAVVDKNLPFPETDQPSAQEIANQVYFANHFMPTTIFPLAPNVVEATRRYSSIVLNQAMTRPLPLKGT